MRILLYIFYIVLFFYTLSLVGRVILGTWVRRRQHEFNEERQRYTRAARDKARRSEGRVTIRDTRTERKRVEENVGEYVDYEEITETEMKEGGTR